MYEVVVLIEQPIAPVDARQIVALHHDVPDSVHYHVLVPVEDAAARVEATIGSLAASEVMGTSPLVLPEEDLDRFKREVVEESLRSLHDSLQALRDAEARADGEVTASDPLDALTRLVQARKAAEVVILTRAHLVAELLRVDWSHRAQRRLKVPVLHLLAHKAP